MDADEGAFRMTDDEEGEGDGEDCGEEEDADVDAKRDACADADKDHMRIAMVVAWDLSISGHLATDPVWFAICLDLSKDAPHYPRKRGRCIGSLKFARLPAFSSAEDSP